MQKNINKLIIIIGCVALTSCSTAKKYKRIRNDTIYFFNPIKTDSFYYDNSDFYKKTLDFEDTL